MNQLLVTNACYQHKDIHTDTWECPGRGLKSLIDYILVRKDVRSLVCDVEAVRGAEISSDHHLVLMKMRKKEGQESKSNPANGEG